ncbi:MAG TPA: hypothetical protein VFC84_02270 [Desulfosporosinus sp.]|nr:hypothetical protein [Desulfosporosinus sp.]
MKRWFDSSTNTRSWEGSPPSSCVARNDDGQIGTVAARAAPEPTRNEERRRSQ